MLIKKIGNEIAKKIKTLLLVIFLFRVPPFLIKIIEKMTILITSEFERVIMTKNEVKNKIIRLEYCFLSWLFSIW